MAEGTSTFHAAIGPGPARAVLEAEGFDVGVPEPVTLTVLDTFDGRLAAAGMRLVATRSDDRTELVLVGNGPDAVAPVHGLPTGAGDLPAGPLRARVAAVLDVRVLLPVLQLDAVRQRAARRNRAGKTTAAATIWSEVRTSGSSFDGTFVDVRSLAGYPDPAARACATVERGGFQRCPTGLVDHVAAAAGVALDGQAPVPGVTLDPGADAVDAYRAVLANLRDALVANLDGAADDVDPEFLHDLRVAVRRSRAVLANAKGVIPRDVRRRARDDFAWFGRISGPARDLDVYQIEWPAYVAGLDDATVAALEPVRDHLRAERDAAHDRLAPELRGSHAAEVLDRWSRWLDTPIDAEADLPRRARRPIGRVVARRIRRAHDAMVERGRAITPDTPAAALHDLRKDAKQLRYLLECFGGLYDPAGRKRFVKRLKALQDHLGEHQDAEVHAAQLREVSSLLAGSAPVEAVVAAGQLIERLEQRRLTSRAQFAEHFAAFDTGATRRALAAMLGAAEEGDSQP